MFVSLNDNGFDQSIHFSSFQIIALHIYWIFYSISSKIVLILAFLVAIAYTLETGNTPNNNPVVYNQDLGIMAGTVSKSVVRDLNLDNFFFKKYKKKKKGAVYFTKIIVNYNSDSISCLFLIDRTRTQWRRRWWWRWRIQRRTPLRNKYMFQLISFLISVFNMYNLWWLGMEFI